MKQNIYIITQNALIHFNAFSIKLCFYASHSKVVQHQFCFILTFSFSLAGVNKCPEGSKCRKWTEVYPDPKSMCEQIWSNSYLYTTYSKTSGRCMQMWFTGPNPNMKVAEYYLNNAQQHQSFALTTLLFLAVACFSVMMC